MQDLSHACCVLVWFLIRVLYGVVACNLAVKRTLYTMALSGMDAMRIWLLGRRLEADSGRAYVPPQAVTVQYNMDPVEQRLWVALRISSVQLGDGSICDIDGHITLLTVRDVQRIDLSPVFWHDVIQRGKRIVDRYPLHTAGELVPLFTKDDNPHRLLVTLHVQSPLHLQLFQLRNHIETKGDFRGRSDKRSSFHLSIDGMRL